MSNLDELVSPDEPKPWLGRMPAPDERDKRFPVSTALRGIKPEVDWRYWYPGPVLDQGPYPHCVGYAWRAFLNNSPVRTKTGISPVDLYNRAQHVDEWPGTGYAGTSVRAGLKILQEEGHIAQYLWATRWEEMANWILSDDPVRQGPVVLGTSWYSGMETPDKDGVVQPEGQWYGGHAYLCVGYNRNTGLFTFQNSWGRSWGANGRFRMYEEDVQALLDDWGEAAVAVEQPVLEL